MVWGEFVTLKYTYVLFMFLYFTCKCPDENDMVSYENLSFASHIARVVDSYRVVPWGPVLERGDGVGG